MLSVTERAAVALEELRRVNNAVPGEGVKLVPSGPGSVGMTIEAPGEGDEVIGSGEEPLLIVDSRIAGDLDGSEVDYDTRVVEGQSTSRFILLPPNELRRAS